MKTYSQCGWRSKEPPYIDSGTSINNLFNKELLIGLLKLNRTLKVQTSDEPIYLLEIRSQQYLMLPTSIHNNRENVIPNMSLVVKLVNKCYTIYNIRDDNAIYVLS